MKLGIIGSGSIVKEFLPELVKMSGLEVAGIQGTQRSAGEVRQLCNEYGIPLAAQDFDGLCASGIDTVYIAVPNHLHYEYCRRALEKGLNVIVEKPLASNDAEANELAGLAKGRSLFLFEAISTLYLGNYRKIQEFLPCIGNIKLVQSQFSQYSRRYDKFRSGQVLPVFDPQKSGGALMDLNLYNLHFVMGLFGMPSAKKYYANIEKGIDTSGVVMLEYPGFSAACTAAKDCRGICGSIIQGTDGIIRTDRAPNSVGKVTLELNNGTVEEYDDGMAGLRMVPEFNAFIDAVNHGGLAFCYGQLDKSLNVSRIQTQVRLEAGIWFPADKRD